jgi:hypothetical protein
MLVGQLLELPEAMMAIMLFMMSWPQLVTGMVGIFLARKISTKISFAR